MAPRKSRLGGAPINPEPVRGDMTAAELIDTSFLAYNGGACARPAACSRKRCSSPTSRSG